MNSKAETNLVYKSTTIRRYHYQTQLIGLSTRSLDPVTVVYFPLVTIQKCTSLQQFGPKLSSVGKGRKPHLQSCFCTNMAISQQIIIVGSGVFGCESSTSSFSFLFPYCELRISLIVCSVHCVPHEPQCRIRQQLYHSPRRLGL